MGYTTDFTGGFRCTPTLTAEQVQVINDFNEERHDPDSHPGYYCQWVATQDGTQIEWDQSEKFYEYTDWLQLIVDNFLVKWGVTINGAVKWSGEDPDDNGMLVAVANTITEAAITYE